MCIIKHLKLKNCIIKYELQYKKVKNINLRISADGKISVSAGRWVSQRKIESFLISKEDFIIRVLDKYRKKVPAPLKQYFAEEEICDVIQKICDRVYPYFKEKGIEYPQIKFRRMISQWGNCRKEKGILTFNKNLMYAPYDCIEYVVMHEFTHFLQPNHSRLFYNELSKICPDWKERRNLLKTIILR